VASGAYSLFHNFVSYGIQEEWSIHELPDGAQIYRVDSKARNMLIVGYCSALEQGGRTERLDIRCWAVGLNSNGELVRGYGNATYIFAHDRIQIGYSVNNDARSHSELPLPQNCVVCVSESDFFHGHRIIEVAKRMGVSVAVCSCYVDASDPPNIMFDVLTYEDAATAGDYDLVTVAGKPVLVQCYQEKYWIDEYGVLVLYEESWGRHEYETRLTQYARRPEPPQS
jgi:hypothetical protein